VNLEETIARDFTMAGHVAWLMLRANEHGLTECRMVTARAARPLAANTPQNIHLKKSVKQLQEYFAGKRSHFDVPLADAGTEFQMDVWEATRAIPFGEMLSYGDVAKRIGRPDGARAVGTALNRNPLLLFTPCHRVIGKNGALCGFGCGLDWKEILLRHEGAQVAEQFVLPLLG